MSNPADISSPGDEARTRLLEAFKAAGRHDYNDYIRYRLAGDFSVAVLDVLGQGPSVENHVMLEIAQRAIDDLRRYSFDNTPERRVARAERLQADLDAVTSRLRIEHSHRWPRHTWISDDSDASYLGLVRQVNSTVESLQKATLYDTNSVVRGVVAEARQTVTALLAAVNDRRDSLRQLEADLQWEECESEHWARKATLEGDLGRNPPTFLVDVVGDLEKENARLRLEIERLTVASSDSP